MFQHISHQTKERSSWVQMYIINSFLPNGVIYFFEFIKTIDNRLTTLQQEVKFNLYIKCITLSVIIELSLFRLKQPPYFFVKIRVYPLGRIKQPIFFFGL